MTNRLERDSALLVVVDVQEKLMPVIDRSDEVERNIVRLVRGSAILGIPVLVTEQYVRGLGPTVGAVREALTDTVGFAPIEKSCFSAQGCDVFAARLAGTARRQVLIAGVETHVCVYQTSMDLVRGGFEVTIIADAVSSRTAENRDIALRRLTAEGVKLSSTEMALFELTQLSGTNEFRAIASLIK